LVLEQISAIIASTMRFSQLADYFEKLEAISSRIELTRILSSLFKEVSGEEIDKVVYLLQGRVAPFFEPIEMGMADRMVIQALAKTYEVNSGEVEKLNTELGDLGLVAEGLGNKRQVTSNKLEVPNIFEGLHEVATTGGEGSVEKKVLILSSLLEKMNPLEAKYLIRIVLSRLRLGIGDPTVLDALSVAKLGDKSARIALEEAYNKTSDLGFVAKTFYEKGLEEIKKTKLQIGKPIRPALAERLPDAESIIKRVGTNFAAEPKYDGFRNQVHLDHEDVKIFSRNLENMTSMFPDIVEAVKKEVKATTAIFEGEALAYNRLTGEFLPFQETTKRRRKYDIGEFAQKLPLKLFAFDLLYLNGKDITTLPYQERRKQLSSIISRSEKILVSDEEILHSSEELKEMFDEEISVGLEGVMIKKLDSPYKAGARGFHWIKFKRMAAGELSDTIDCVLLGIYTGMGKRTEFGVGGLLVGVYNDKEDRFDTVSKIGTGLTDEEWRRIRAMADKTRVSKKPARVNSILTPSFWVAPEIVLEVFADEITRSPVHTAGKVGDQPGYALRFPRLVSFRGADKRTEDTTTVKELVKMYHQQKNVKISS
jgi:DNA ligase-1